MDRERAREILANVGPMGSYPSMTSQEWDSVKRVSSTMPGHTTFHDALVRIGKGEVEVVVPSKAFACHRPAGRA